MELSKRIEIEKEELEYPEGEILMRFDDPSGPSPSRFVVPLYDLRVPVGVLQGELQDKVCDLEVGGVYSGAYTGESYAILFFALGGIVGGLLGAIGEDLWNALKKACSGIMKRNSARRNFVEVALEFDDLDVVFHYESCDSSCFPDMFSEADSLLEELRGALSCKREFIGNAETLELRRRANGKGYTCGLYPYRRCRKMIEMQRNKDNS